jgi:hypothetical protein
MLYNLQDSSVAFKQWSEVEFGVHSPLLHQLSQWFDNGTQHHTAKENVPPSE